MQQLSFWLSGPHLEVGVREHFRFHIPDIFQCHGREIQIFIIAENKLMHLYLKGDLRATNFTDLGMDQCRIIVFQPFLHWLTPVLRKMENENLKSVVLSLHRVIQLTCLAEYLFHMSNLWTDNYLNYLYESNFYALLVLLNIKVELLREEWAIKSMYMWNEKIREGFLCISKSIYWRCVSVYLISHEWPIFFIFFFIKTVEHF